MINSKQIIYDTIDFDPVNKSTPDTCGMMFINEKPFDRWIVIKDGDKKKTLTFSQGEGFFSIDLHVKNPFQVELTIQDTEKNTYKEIISLKKDVETIEITPKSIPTQENFVYKIKYFHDENSNLFFFFEIITPHSIL